MKILVVEDHPTQQKLAHIVLSEAGDTVSAANAADQAFASIAEGRPQVILLDLSLPGTDGLILAQKLKSDPATRDIFIVAVTSYPEKYPKAAALAAGCDAYLLKPLSTRELPSQLAALVQKQE
ncbi:MAG: two-component response regulator [Verrucomicrobiales bacterium]|nr:two-component response regulator [Verrucomicrobiales bacterium]